MTGIVKPAALEKEKVQAVFLPPVQCLKLREVLIAEKIGEILGLLNLGEDIAPVIGMQFLEKACDLTVCDGLTNENKMFHCRPPK